MLRFVALVLLFAVAVYFMFRLLDQRRAAGARGRRPAPPPQRRAVAPDDDEDFLRRLDRFRKKNEDPPQTG